MERGREGRRGVTGAGPVSAPRRPRTSGFKDTPVAEDGEDVMDDVHNQRLRERPKKDSTGSVPQVMPSGSLGSTSRNKRKRQGSQELQGQVRSGIVDELDETTEDIEVGASEDDDDPPPPPIARRPGKLRLQGKFVDDGIPADLPTVPRKARTAILKRPQESPSPPVGDSSHQGLPVIPRSPAPVSAPSSSPVVSLKPGRRMKSSSLKLRAVKAHKVSTPTVVSEQEVEVAEALFDLARMFTNQSNPSKVDVIIDMNPKPEEDSKHKVESEANLQTNESANNIIACPQPAFPSSRSLPTSTAVSSPIVPLFAPAAPETYPNVSLSCATSSAIVSAGGTILVPPMMATSHPPVTAPPAEAPKRKRPRLRTRPDLVGFVPEVGFSASSGDVSNSCRLSGPSPGLEAVQILTSCPPNTDSSSVDVEAALLPPKPTSMLDSASQSPILLSEPQSLGLGSPAGRPGSQLREKESIAADEVKKVELGTSPSPLHSLYSAPRDKKPAAVGVSSPSATSTFQMDQASKRMSGNGLANVDLDGSPMQQPICAHDQAATGSGQPVKFHFDLMAPLVTKPVVSLRSERTLEVSGNTVDDSLKKCLVTAQVGSSGQPSWTEREKGRDGEKQPDHEMQWEEDRKYETESEREKCKEIGLGRERAHVVHREGDSEPPLQREGDTSKEKDREGGQGREEHARQTHQRQGKAQKLEARAPKTEIIALSNATSAAVSSFSPSAPFVASNVATGVISFPVTSVGTPSWPVGLPPMGSAAAAAVWPSGALLGGDVDENAPPAIQLPNPYTIQARQLQPWKRCASHVYIAHFIDLQQQMTRHPFMHAAYQNSGSLFGTKPYNLNIPLPPAEALFGNVSGGPVLGCVSGVAGDGSVSGLGVVPCSEGNLGVASTITNAQSKDRAYGEASCKKQPQPQQQPQQPLPNLSSQSGPGFGFPVTQASTGGVGGLAAAAPAACGGPVGNAGSGGGSAPVGGSSTSTTGSNIAAGPGTSNGGVVSHAVAQAQYLQAVMQQGGFRFPFQAAAHFGTSFNGRPGHMGPQQATQFFGGPFYTTHLVHPPAHMQQQVPLGTNVSGGLPSVQKQQHHALQQTGRNFPPASQQQPTPAPVTQSPSQSQQQHPQGTASQQIQHLTEREGRNIGENNSSSENKFSMLQRNVYGQGNPHVTVSAVNSTSTLVLGGGSQTLPPQDFNLLSALGAKQQLEQSASQQHHASGPSLHTSFKGIDQQSPQTFSATSIASMNRGAVVGPGPLGLAPVAAVMAPQGHAMLHSVADASRGQTQHQHPQNQQPVSAQSHQHSLQSTQQRGVVQIQTTPPAVISVEDVRTFDGNTFSSRTGREPAEDRKMLSKRGMSSTSNLTRVDSDHSSTVQGASSGSGILHSRITGSGAPTLNLMTPAPTILLSRPVGHPPGSGLQQTGTILPGNQNSKQALPRGKLLAGFGGGGALVSSTQSQVSYAERPSPPSLPSKIQGTPSSSTGPNIPQGTQVPRQSQIAPHPQLKLSNRSTLSSLPTPSGTAPQAVLAAAIAKSQQVPQQQQSRSQALAGTTTGSSPRLPSSNCAGTATSTGLPLPPLPPASKSAPTSASKSNLTSKTSFTLPHKPSSAVSSKRATTLSGSHVSSIMGPSPIVQNLPLKPVQNQHHPQLPPQQPQQKMSQYHTQPSNLPQQSTQQHSSQPPQSLISTQYHQQAHLTSHQQLHQVHNKQALIQQQQTHQMQRVFLQNPAFQSSGSALNALPLQQSSQQVLHQGTAPPSQLQQRASSPQQPLQPQHNLQGGAGSSSGISSNGTLALGPPTLTLGTGNNGNATCTRAPGSDCLATSQSPASRSNSTANKLTSGPGASQPSSRVSSGGPSFMQAQFVPNVSSGPQPSGSPRNSSGPQYMQATANSESSSKQTEQIVMTDGNGQEQVNGIRSLSSPSLMPQMPHSGSPSLQPSLARQLTGKLIGKSLGVQFSGSNYSESISRSGLILSVPAPSLSSSNILQSFNQSPNNDNSGGLTSSVDLGVDGRSLFGGSSSVANPGAVSSQGLSSSAHQSLHLMASGPAASNSQSVGQTSTSSLQP